MWKPVGGQNSSRWYAFATWYTNDSGWHQNTSGQTWIIFASSDKAGRDCNIDAYIDVWGWIGGMKQSDIYDPGCSVSFAVPPNTAWRVTGQRYFSNLSFLVWGYQI